MQHISQDEGETWVASTKEISGEMIRDPMTESLEKRFQGQTRMPRNAPFEDGRKSDIRFAQL